MKMSEEIKRGLVTCTELVMPADVQHAAMADALAYIQQLETENHQLLTKAQQLESTISQVSKALCGKENATLKELLQAAYQLKARAPRWISVEERLPEGEVLAANFSKGTYGYGEYIIGYVAPYSGSETNGYGAENSFELLDGVTHWMQLPEPPKEIDHE